MTNPRARNTGTLGRYASAATRAEPLIKPTVADPGVQRWINAVTQRLEVAEGARSQWDEVITRRDLGDELVRVGVVTQTTGRPPGGGGVATVRPDGTVAYVSIESFSESIRTTKLFTDLTRRIDDPARFDDLPERTRALLLEDIAQVRQQADASIRRVDDVIKTATESFAQTVTTVQANISSAAAGVRQVAFAQANENRAVAGLVTTITARLDNFTGGAPGTATVESKMTAIADRSTGLEAQYTLKVAAGGYVAGYGVASTTNVDGNATSAFIIQADKFAIVDSSYTGGLTNTPASQYVMFAVDAGGVYVKGNINTTGNARFRGTYSGSDGIGAIYANETQAADIGAVVYAGAVGGVLGKATGSTALYGVRGLNSSTGSDAAGVSGETSQASTFGGFFKSTSASGFGLYAENDLTLVTPGVAFWCNGKMTLDGSLTWNGYAYAVPAGSTTTFMRNDGTWATPAGATAGNQVVKPATGQTITLSGNTTGSGTATFTATNKPGGSTANEWFTVVIDGNTFDIPIWAR